MIDLTDIKARLDRGLYSRTDVAILKEEYANLGLPDEPVIDRLNRGLSSLEDVRAVYIAIAAKYGLPSDRELAHEAAAAAAKAVADAQAARDAASLVALEAEAKAEAERAAIAGQVTEAQIEAADSRRRVEQFTINTANTEVELAQKRKIARSFMDQLGDG